MCTLALYFKVFPGYPLVVAANRDEHYDRPSGPPLITGTDPRILAGTDLRAGGTWLGVNDYGLLVGILNRRQKPGAIPQDNYRSRGLLCLELLRLRGVKDLDQVFASLLPNRYLPFTVVCADAERACAAYNTDQSIEQMRLAQGLHVFSNSFEFSTASKETNRVYEAFSKLSESADRMFSIRDYVPQAAKALGEHAPGNHLSDPREGICVHGDISGTVSSSIIFFSDSERQFRTYYCIGAPCQSSFQQFPRINVR
jgi:uncharacterized protein with NRDE domain